MFSLRWEKSVSLVIVKAVFKNTHFMRKITISMLTFRLSSQRNLSKSKKIFLIVMNIKLKLFN